MINKQQAQSIAREEFSHSTIESDSILHMWPHATVSEPVLVHDVYGQPAYWIVPFMAEGYVVGFARILKTGSVFTIGSFCARSDSINRCPKHVTGLGSEQVSVKVINDIKLSTNEKMAEPMFVHDGPIGREAWLVVISETSVPTRWLFVTQGGIYERAARQKLPNTPEA